MCKCLGRNSRSLPWLLREIRLRPTSDCGPGQKKRCKPWPRDRQACHGRLQAQVALQHRRELVLGTADEKDRDVPWRLERADRRHPHVPPKTYILLGRYLGLSS